MNPTARDFLMAAKAREREQLQDILGIGQLTGRIAKLVHMLQRERGASNIWLCSAGNLFAEDRRGCIEQSDREIALFRQALAEPGWLPGYALSGSLACALYYLERLPALRATISSQNVTPAQAMAQFNAMLRQLLSIVPEASNAVADVGVAKALAALFCFMQGKELAGQERAIGALGFTLGAFSEGLRQQLVDCIDSQQRCFETFCSIADERQRQRYLTTAQPGLEMERLRRQACTRLSKDGKPADLALHWFALLSSRIDALKAVEDSLIETVLSRTQQALGQVLSEALQSEDDLQRWVAGHEGNPEDRYLDRQLLPLVRQQAQQLEVMAQKMASLQATLEDRKAIDKAKALLIHHQGYSEEQAWQALRKMAMNQNKRMVEVANAMLSVADLWQLPLNK